MDDESQPSLRDFISENHTLLSALAVLIAIATFVGQLPIHWLGNALLFITIAAVIVVWSELYSVFPKHGSTRLWLFKNIIMFGLGGVIFYWFLAFPIFWNIFLFLPLFGLLVYMSFSILKQLVAIPFVRRIFGEKGHRMWWQQIIMVIYVGVVIYGLFGLLAVSIGASPGFNLLLQLVRINFH